MVRLWSPENPTREKISSGERPSNALRLKYSGIRRPDVEARAPNVKDLPAIPLGKSLLAVRPVLALAVKTSGGWVWPNAMPPQSEAAIATAVRIRLMGHLWFGMVKIIQQLSSAG